MCSYARAECKIAQAAQHAQDTHGPARSQASLHQLHKTCFIQ